MTWKERFRIVNKWSFKEGPYFLIVEKDKQFSYNMHMYKKYWNAVRAAKRLFEKEQEKIDRTLLGE